MIQKMANRFMSEIEELDKNFAKKEIEDKPDTLWYDVRKAPFEIYGLYDPQNEPVFRRMPEDIAASVSKGVRAFAEHTAGGRVRFSTDSPYIALRAVYPKTHYMAHMAPTGSSGFDLYVDEGDTHTFISSFRPDIQQHGGLITYVEIEGTRFEGKRNNYTINFPLYNNVSSVEIGICKGSCLEKGAAYRAINPFVYYGQSVTQGGCASRPGNSYQGFISRRFNVDFLNLGFSGSARGEQEIIDYICSLDMSIFICDYDGNEPNAQELRKMHYNVYECFRNAQPYTPCILISKASTHLFPEEAKERRRVIEDTYNRAIALGDKNIYYIDGSTLFAGLDYSDCTVDLAHPNDLGFWRMGQVIGNVIEDILEKANGKKESENGNFYVL